MKRRTGIVVTFLFVCTALLELLSYAVIFLSRPILDEEIRTTADIYEEQSARIHSLLANSESGLATVDAVLGWRYRPRYTSATDHINSMGLRSDHEYSVRPIEGVLRVAAFGDSFVYGTEVVDADAWPAVIERLYDDIEVLNYGVGGYGTDQASLRFGIEGMDLSPHVVLIGFAPIDLRRVVNVYRRFMSSRESLLTKPRFHLDAGGALRLTGTPIRTVHDWKPILEDPSLIRRWGSADQWYEPLIYENFLYDLSASVRVLSTVWIRLENRYLDPERWIDSGVFNTSSSAFKIQMAVFEQFVEDVRESGARPLVLILPNRESLESSLRGRAVPFQPLVEALRASEIAVLDATDAFKRSAEPAVGEWFAAGGHYSPAGNYVLADWLGGYLRALPASAPE